MINDYANYTHHYLIMRMDSFIQQILNEKQYKTYLLSAWYWPGSDLVLG